MYRGTQATQHEHLKCARCFPPGTVCLQTPTQWTPTSTRLHPRGVLFNLVHRWRSPPSGTHLLRQAEDSPHGAAPSRALGFPTHVQTKKFTETKNTGTPCACCSAACSIGSSVQRATHSATFMCHRIQSSMCLAGSAINANVLYQCGIFRRCLVQGNLHL